MKKKWKEAMDSGTGMVMVTVIIWLLVILAIAVGEADASGPGYQNIEQTVDPEVEAWTEKAAEIYPVCPELLQAIIFYESCNRMDVSNGSCVGYMQVSAQYHGSRADRLGVSIHEGWGNILTGTDYLMELLEEYEDVATALMVYNGSSDALERAGSGNLTGYARNILELSEKLERLHGK